MLTMGGEGQKYLGLCRRNIEWPHSLNGNRQRLEI